MNTLKLPGDLAQQIAQTLNWKLVQVTDLLDFEEDERGYFWARLKPKKAFEPREFRLVCNLVRTLGGEDYLLGAKAWRVPGPYVKTQKDHAPSESIPKQEHASGESIPRRDESPNPIDNEIVESLKGSAQKIGHLYPVLVDSFGNTIDGFHRRKANPNWPTYKVEAVSDPLQLAKARLIANERRNVPAEEKRSLLDQIAKMTGWTPKQIADDLGWNERTVYRYLSADYKKPEPGQLAQTKADSDRLSLGMEKTVSSANLKAEDLSEGKLREILDSPRAREVLADMKKEEVSEGPSDESGESEEGPLFAEHIETTEETEEPKEGPSEEGPPQKTRRIEGMQVGEFTCPECKQKFFIDHISASNHKLTLIREAPE